MNTKKNLEKNNILYIIVILLLVAIILFSAAIFSNTAQQARKISGLSRACEAIFEIKSQEDQYFDNAVINPVYYSDSAEDKNRFAKQFEQIDAIFQHKNSNLEILFEQDTSLRSAFNAYVSALDTIEKSTFRRGFESKGLYGKLRQTAHKIEALYQDSIKQLSKVPLLLIGKNIDDSKIIHKNLFDTLGNEALTYPVLQSISKNLLAYTNLLNARRYEKDYLYRHTRQYYDMARHCAQNIQIAQGDVLINQYINLLDSVSRYTSIIEAAKSRKTDNLKKMLAQLEMQINKNTTNRQHILIMIGFFCLTLAFGIITYHLYSQFKENEQFEKNKAILIKMHDDKVALDSAYEEVGKQNKLLEVDKKNLEQDKILLYENYERLLRLAKHITEISTFDQSFKNIVQRAAATVKILMDDKIDMFVAGQINAHGSILTLYKQLYLEDDLRKEIHNVETDYHRNSVRCFKTEQAISSFDGAQIDVEDLDIEIYPSVIYVPLNYQNKVVGVLGIKSRMKDNLNHLHLNKLKLVAYFVEQAYSNNQQINSLISLMKAIRESETLKDIINNMGTSMIDLFPDVMSFGIGILDKKDTQIQFTGTYRKSIDEQMLDAIVGHPEARQYRDAAYPASLCIASNQMYFRDVNRPSYELTFEGSQNSKSFIYHKLKVEGKTIGVFSTHFFEKETLTVNDTDKIRMLSYFFQELSILYEDQNLNS